MVGFRSKKEDRRNLEASLHHETRQLRKHNDQKESTLPHSFSMTNTHTHTHTHTHHRLSRKEAAKILELDPKRVSKLTDADIKSSFRSLALKHHPDKCKSMRKDEATAKFQKISAAYTRLTELRDEDTEDEDENYQDEYYTDEVNLAEMFFERMFHARQSRRRGSDFDDDFYDEEGDFFYDLVHDIMGGSGGTVYFDFDDEDDDDCRRGGRRGSRSRRRKRKDGPRIRKRDQFGNALRCNFCAKHNIRFDAIFEDCKAGEGCRSCGGVIDDNKNNSKNKSSEDAKSSSSNSSSKKKTKNKKKKNMKKNKKKGKKKGKKKRR